MEISVTEANGSAAPSVQTAGSPHTVQTTTATTDAPINGRGADPLAALSDDLRSHPSLQAYRKGAEFDLGGLVKEHVNLQSLIGKKGVIPPGDKDGPEAWDRYYSQLGRPQRPEQYQFAKPQGFAGYSDEFASAYRAAAHKQGLTAQQAAGMHDWFVKSAVEADQMQGQRARMDGDSLDQALRQKWGNQYDAMVASGRRAARAFAPPESLDQLEQAIGGPAVMELFANIGERMREDGVIGGGAASFGLTPEQARAEIARMDTAMNDPKSPAMDKLHPEHASWMKRREQLFTAAYPG
jgi:hypothetical protein